MKFNKKVFLITFIVFIMSCVTTGDSLPEWAEIKPINTTKEIYFVYGPTESRARAREGLFKEISEYFGVEVASVDKFVKQVTFENGETDVNQSKDSQVNVISREKGLNSIEIREIWSGDNDTKWCILASLDRAAEDKIRQEVESEIEAERVISVLDLAETYTIDIEELYNNIDDQFNNLHKLEIKMGQSVEKASSLLIPHEVMDQSHLGIDIGDDFDKVVKNIKRLTSEMKLIQSKSSLLKNQLKNNSLALIQLDFFITESLSIYDQIVLKNESIKDSETVIQEFREALTLLFLKSELDVLGQEEGNKKRLGDELKRIKDHTNQIFILKDEVELLYKQSEDILRSIKRVSYSDSMNSEDKTVSVTDFLVTLEKMFNGARDKVDIAYKLKSAINHDRDNAISSRYITEDQKGEVNKLSAKINSPVSWIEIYKDKITVNYNSGKRVADELFTKDLISRKLDVFTTNLINKTGNGLDLTIGEFTIDDTSISSSFSGYIKSSLFSIMANRGNLNIIDYNYVTDYLSEKNINPKAIYTGTAVTNSLVNNIVYGDYWVKNGDVELKISLKNIADNRVLYSETIALPKKSIPSDISLKPNNYDDMISLDKKIPGNGLDQGFEIWPDKGSGSTYLDGENMIINAFSPVGGYVKIYHISADNELTLVFPNSYDRNNRFEPGRNYTIGDSSYPFRFKLGKPYGTESLKALFSVEQFPDLVEESYYSDFLYSGVRGINIESRINGDLNLGSAVTNSYYTIIE